MANTDEIITVAPEYTSGMLRDQLLAQIVAEAQGEDCAQSARDKEYKLDVITYIINLVIKSPDAYSKPDLELYYALSDKYNVALIDNVIKACTQRLVHLFNNQDDLFDVTVYFKLKSFDDEEKVLKFRPMHTARLIDMICMVSILSCLMFEDEETRTISDLSKLLPHNFYGNIPSTDVRFLFQKWQKKYQEYTDNVIEHCRAYQNNHRFLTEVTLDIQNFFPSINPKVLYDFIIAKMSSTYRGDDEYALKVAVSKLLLFKLCKENVEPWQDKYYVDGYTPAEDGLFMSCGVAQGLPQSYFFGNLSMMMVKSVLMEEGFFKGDAYFYVDDSVIYVETTFKSDEDFKQKLVELNNRLQEDCNKSNEADSDYSEIIGARYTDFQSKLNYVIHLHEDGKSTYCHIDKADNRLGGIENLGVSHNTMLSLDEVDDSVSLSKLRALDSVISKEIKDLEEKDTSKLNNKDTSRLKMLRRFKKYYLYRNRRLKIRTEGGPNEDSYNDFCDRFLSKEKNIADWFKQEEEDIFQSEYRMLIQLETRSKAERIRDDIIEFEQKVLSEHCPDKPERSISLYYAKDASASVLMKTLSYDSFASLVRWANENFRGLKCLSQEDRFKGLLIYLGLLNIIENKKDENQEKQKEQKEKKQKDKRERMFFNDILDSGYEDKEYTRFVARNSSEFQRLILNVFFSEVIGVRSSDSLSFTKQNSHRLHYTELRILARLRNKEFELTDFKAFVNNLNPNDVSNRMGIDMGLMEVLSLFIHHVRRPEWVDALIQTHRLTKGLWYNGSKFLNSYTLHNEEHAVTLINKSLELVNRIDYFALKNVDYYILFLACYLHDISMVIHPDLYSMISTRNNSEALITEQMIKMRDTLEEFKKIDGTDDKDSRIKSAGKFLLEVFEAVYGYFETEVRDNHSYDSARFVLDKSNSLLKHLEPTLLSYVSKVSESHGYDVIDVYGLKSRAKDEAVSTKYLMILIRLADSLDVANDRVNYHLLRQNLRFMSDASKFHWISHLVTDKIELKPSHVADETKKLNEKPITETININLYLNVKYLSSVNPNTRCANCQCHMVQKSKKDAEHICIDIKSENAGRSSCSDIPCTFLCKWMAEKHGWLIPELVALNDYLFSVNNSLIRTEVKFNIYYNNDINLESDMFDSVQDYLKTEGRIID